MEHWVNSIHLTWIIRQRTMRVGIEDPKFGFRIITWIIQVECIWQRRSWSDVFAIQTLQSKAWNISSWGSDDRLRFSRPWTISRGDDWTLKNDSWPQSRLRLKQTEQLPMKIPWWNQSQFEELVFHKILVWISKLISFSSSRRSRMKTLACDHRHRRTSATNHHQTSTP